MGALPTALKDLTTTVKNDNDQTGGPFLGAVPTPPTGWDGTYAFTANADGTFTIKASGDSTSATAP
jgi:hypothetical protein